MISLGGYTVVVTGFPRTGTSMLMRILKFSGISIIADSDLHLPQHKHDPYGCLEMKDVGTWLASNSKKITRNKAIKIVTPYAEWYPIDRKFKAIFMQRDLNEIVTSLLAMRTVWQEDIGESVSWARGYLRYHNIPTLFIQYRDAIKYPRTTVLQIKDFLGANIDVDKAVKAIDADARNRYKKDPTILGHDRPDHIIRTDFEAYQDLNVQHYGTPGFVPPEESGDENART